MLNGLKIASQEEGIDGVRTSGDKTLVLFGYDGIDGHASLSPEDLDGIAVLDPHANESNRVYNFTDEQNIPWKVSLVDYGVYRFESQGLEGLHGDISADQLFPPNDSLSSPDVAKLRAADILSRGGNPAGTRHFDAAKKIAGPFDLTNSPSDYSKGAPSNQGPDEEKPVPSTPQDYLRLLQQHEQQLLEVFRRLTSDSLAEGEDVQVEWILDQVNPTVDSVMGWPPDTATQLFEDDDSIGDYLNDLAAKGFDEARGGHEASTKKAGPAEGDPDDWMTRVVRGPSKEDKILRELEEDLELHEEEPGEIREERELLDMGTDHLARLGGYDTIMEEILENFPEEQVFAWLQKVKTTLPGHEASVKMAGSDYAYKTELTTPDGYEIDSYNPYADPSKARRFTVWPPKGNAVGDYTTLEEATKAIEQWKQRGDPELLKRDGGANFKVDIPRDDLDTNTYTG